jgi:hypothetical protein
LISGRTGVKPEIIYLRVFGGGNFWGPPRVLAS